MYPRPRICQRATNNNNYNDYDNNNNNNITYMS